MAFARPQLAGGRGCGLSAAAASLLAGLAVLLGVGYLSSGHISFRGRLPVQASDIRAPAAALATAAAAAAAGGSWRGTHEFDLSRHELQNGIVTYGSRARARRAMARLISGLPLRMAFVGGSVTKGHNAAEIGRTDLVSRVFAWIQSTFPHEDHQLLNGAVGAVPSSYFALCISWHIPSNVDLVVLETNLNDGTTAGDTPVRRAHERLIRKLLTLPSRPAVLELSCYYYPEEREWESGLSPYRYHGDDEIGVLAQFYRLPWISVRSLVWGRTPETAQDPSSPRSIRFHPMWDPSDRIHPSELGHRWLAEVVIFWMQQGLEDLARRPLGPEDEEEAQAELSQPLYKDNWEAGSHTCYMADQFRDLVTQHDNAFQWVNEGSEQKPKWGYVSVQPGSSLQMTIKTKVAKNLGAGDLVSVGVAHLQTYEHMGVFEVACIKGCECKALRQSGHNAAHESQMHLAQLLVSASDACRLRVTVLEETHSKEGGHKVKLMGLVVSEVPGMLLGEEPDQSLSVRYWRQADGRLSTLNLDEDQD